MPDQKEKTPLARWKRIELMLNVLPPKNQGYPDNEGNIISLEDWIDHMHKAKGKTTLSPLFIFHRQG